jgi:U3 small nucleolar RNA-associated protein 14
MKQKRAEFLKLKAMQSYQEAKFKRLKHIKSKRYRKILRKEKEKQEDKNLEKLEKEDPAQFKEVLEQLEKKRMKERMSLKHKNTSKWAKQQTIYAKYSDKARDQVQEQLDISKKLTHKLKQFEYNNEDDEDNEAEQKSSVSANLLNQNGVLVNNPWMKMMGDVGVVKNGSNDEAKGAAENNGEYSKPKAFVDKGEIERAEMDADDSEESDNEDYLNGELEEKKNTKDVIDIFKNDDKDEESDKEEEVVKGEAVKVDTNVEIEKPKKKKSKKEEKSKPEELKVEKKEEKNIKPISNEQFVNRNLESAASKSSDGNKPNNKKMNEQQHQLTLSEAFADDDVIEEFKMEKVILFNNLEFFFV